MKVVQCDLICGEPLKDFTTMTTWLPVDRRVHYGTVLTLKGDDTVWTVVRIGSLVRDVTDLNIKWNAP